jgi:hypothetical protein
MNEEAVPILLNALNEYYDYDELENLCDLFDVESEIDYHEQNYFFLAQKLIINIESGNNHRLLSALYKSLITRSKGKRSSTQWQTREYHQELLDKIQKLGPLVEAPGLPTVIAVPEKSPFSAKSEARELFQSAETEITIVDPYIGSGTFDCLRDVKQPVRLLTGSRKNQISTGVNSILKEFLAEGHEIEIRRHEKLHDRYIIFNDRCWLVGSSLKDAGQKAFNVIEFIDSKEKILEDINSKWEEAMKYNQKAPDNQSVKSDG